MHMTLYTKSSKPRSWGSSVSLVPV